VNYPFKVSVTAQFSKAWGVAWLVTKLCEKISHESQTKKCLL